MKRWIYGVVGGQPNELFIWAENRRCYEIASTEVARFEQGDLVSVHQPLDIGQAMNVMLVSREYSFGSFNANMANSLLNQLYEWSRQMCALIKDDPGYFEEIAKACDDLHWMHMLCGNLNWTGRALPVDLDVIQTIFKGVSFALDYYNQYMFHPWLISFLAKVAYDQTMRAAVDLFPELLERAGLSESWEYKDTKGVADGIYHKTRKPPSSLLPEGHGAY